MVPQVERGEVEIWPQTTLANEGKRKSSKTDLPRRGTVNLEQTVFATELAGGPEGWAITLTYYKQTPEWKGGANRF